MTRTTTINASELEPGHVIRADLCVVGAGAAGIAIAHELAGSSLDVCLIEAGEPEYRRSVQTLYAGYNTGLPNYELTSSRVRMLGGTTTRWSGQCAPLNADDFEARAWVPHSGWPFDLAHLEPWYRRANDLLGLPPYDYSPEAHVGPNRPALPSASRTLGTKSFRFVEQTDLRPLYRSIAERCTNLRSVLNANVTKIELDESGRRVAALETKTLNGRAHRVEAGVFVLATGGIENSRLLLVSNVGNNRDQVGRYFMDHPFFFSGVVRFNDPSLEFNIHTLEGYEDLALSEYKVATLEFPRETLQREQLVNVGVSFLRRPAFKTTRAYNSSGVRSLNALREAAQTAIPTGPRWSWHLGRVLRGTPDILRSQLEHVRALFTQENVLALRSTLEHAPNPDSRIRLAPARDRLGLPRPEVDWRMGDLERHSLHRFHEILAHFFKQAGLGEITTQLDPDPDIEGGWPSSLLGGMHHMGGTRMHVDPSRGVVDADARVHGVENLYIAGSSVFPTCGYANPTFTIIALALRLADHLRNSRT